MSQVVDFDTWNETQLKEFVGFNTGKDLRFVNGRYELCAEAKQIYAADPSTLTRFGDFIRSGGKVAIEGRGAQQPAYGAYPPAAPYGAYPPPASFATPPNPFGGPPPSATPYPSAFPAYPPPAAGDAPKYPSYPSEQPSYPPSSSAYPPSNAAYPPPSATYPNPNTVPQYPSSSALSHQPAPHAGQAYPPPAVDKAKLHGQGQPYQQPQYTSPHPTGPSALLAQPERRRKALLIGCNYPGTRAELRGCVNDALCMEYLLKSKFGFRPENIRVLRDDAAGGRSASIMPTRANIMANIRWLMSDVRPNDSLFFHFSGHGSQQRDRTGRERDGLNETICPTDFERRGQIIDDELNIALVRPLPRGATLHAVVDACHSGTAMDLPFVTKQDKATKMLRWVQESSPMRHGSGGGLAVQFGACKDSQTAADTSALASGTHTGAATFLFIQAIEDLSKAGNHNITYAQIISQMWKEIEKVNGKKAGKPSLGGILGSVLGAAVSGGTGAAAGALFGALTGSNVGGQSPQLSASENFNLNMALMV